MIGQILNASWTFLRNLFQSMMSGLADLFGYLFNGLISVLKAIFRPILIVVAIIFYFIYKLAELVSMIFQVLLSIGKLLYSFVMGLFKTLAGLTWTSSTPNHGSWSQPISEVFKALEPYQLDKIAYVLMFVIWVMTAIAAIKIISSRGGAE